MPKVDVVVLTRDELPLRTDVENAIRSQTDVDVQLHRVIGTPRATDDGRWETIARARNVGRTLGSAPWIMFVDDDVVLGDGTISQLVSELDSLPAFAARAADYLGERQAEGAPHVAMGATVFRRDELAEIPFRWEESKCECSCMTEDLRRRRLGIDYSAAATATHLESGSRTHATSATPTSSDATRSTATATESSSSETEPRDGEILAAFNRLHLGLFLDQFVAGLRANGNNNQVHALTYGLRGKHVRQLQQTPGITVHQNPHTIELVFLARMNGFLSILRDMCPETPVAYWDAGDVLFQTSLEPLWEAVRQQPQKLHVVEEPLPFKAKDGGTPHERWVNRIVDPVSRKSTLALLRDRPVINGGFIASTAGRLVEYFELAYGLSVGRLLGAGGGDQVILNVCRYERPDDFVVIDETWNYCLYGRKKLRIRGGKYVDSTQDNRIVSVVHGNARSLVL